MSGPANTFTREVWGQGYHTYDHRSGPDGGRTQHANYRAPSRTRHPTDNSGNALPDRAHSTIRSARFAGRNIAVQNLAKTSRSQRSDPDRKIHPRTHCPWCMLDSARSWTTVGAESRCGSPSRARRAAPRKTRGSGPAQRRAASEIDFRHIQRALPPAPDQATSRRQSLRCSAPPRSPERRVHNAFVSRASWLFRA